MSQNGFNNYRLPLGFFAHTFYHWLLQQPVVKKTMHVFPGAHNGIAVLISSWSSSSLVFYVHFLSLEEKWHNWWSCRQSNRCRNHPSHYEDVKLKFVWLLFTAEFDCVLLGIPRTYFTGCTISKEIVHQGVQHFLTYSWSQT